MTNNTDHQVTATVTREGTGRHSAGHTWVLRVAGVYSGTFDTRRQAENAALASGATSVKRA